jgi:hypothetical protein
MRIYITSVQRLVSLAQRRKTRLLRIGNSDVEGSGRYFPKALSQNSREIFNESAGIRTGNLKPQYQV